MPDWFRARKRPVVVNVREPIDPPEEIHTREGTIVATEDDLVIRGVEGEIYPIGREIFAKTYDVVAELREDDSE